MDRRTFSSLTREAQSNSLAATNQKGKNSPVHDATGEFGFFNRNQRSELKFFAKLSFKKAWSPWTPP
jgi:hypothetical protein